MSAWNTEDMGAALPNASGDASAEVPAEAPAQGNEANEAAARKAQEHGWVAPTAYNYDEYAKSIKQLKEEQATFTGDDPEEDSGVGGLRHGEFHSEAAIYEWNDEYGDIGPRHPELEKALFGAENHVRSGKNFSTIQQLDVIQEGVIRLQPVRSFDDAGLHPAMRENVRLAGYDIPTPIQQYCLPAIAKGHDIVACAQTGSGKTAAFLIPILSKLMGKAKKLCAGRPNPATFQSGIDGVRAEPLVLIVCPSRELATQIFDEARRFCYRTMMRPCVIYGGGGMQEQLMQLSRGCDLLIGTPGRLCDFISNRPHALTLRRLKYMVIDEADEMLSSDWDTELKTIMSGGDQEEGNINYLMFSATFPKVCRDLAKEHLAHEHVRIRVGRAGSSHTNIKQDVLEVAPQKKRQCLQDLLFAAPPCRTIIFVNSKRACDEIDDYLFNAGMPVTAIHSDRTQREREDSIRAFRSGKCPILVATGVSARGLDIHSVMHVINFDLPSNQYGGIEEYTHRIGRTGRIGNIGLATSFYTERDEDLAPALVMTMLETGQIIPDFLAHHIPEGFTVDGQGDMNLLKFDADSEGEEEEGAAESGGGGWGGTATAEPSAEVKQPAASGWGAPTPAAVESAASTPAPGGWGAPAAASNTPAPGGWGAPAAAPNTPAPGGWGAPAAASNTPAPGGWGAPAASAPTGW